MGPNTKEVSVRWLSLKRWSAGLDECEERDGVTDDARHITQATPDGEMLARHTRDRRGWETMQTSVSVGVAPLETSADVQRGTMH